QRQSVVGAPRSSASLTKATRWPSGASRGDAGRAFELRVRWASVDTRIVRPAARSRTNTSFWRSPVARSPGRGDRTGSLATRSLAAEANSILVPSALHSGPWLDGGNEAPAPLPVPAALTDTRVVVPAARSRTYRS